MQKLQNAFLAGFAEELEKIAVDTSLIVPVVVGTGLGGVGGFFGGRKLGKTKKQKRLLSALGAGGGAVLGGLIGAGAGYGIKGLKGTPILGWTPADATTPAIGYVPGVTMS